MECETCGGTDFYKESGYFYCNECQTQNQEIREHVFQEETIHVNVKGTKKIKQLKSDKTENKITSWECYNIVICSLTQQLVNLGADKTLKPIVKYLWMRYLEKLEVVNLKHDIRPKLPLVNCRRDASILYTQETKKRKRTKSTSDKSSVATLDRVSLNRERSKKKRALAQAQYEEFSQKSAQEGSTLHSETLASLKSSSELSTKDEGPTSFNRYSVKELRKKMSKRHCRCHKFDKSHMLKCHKFTYAHCSEKYKKGIHFVSPIKLYCIIYLGLLINKDKIQLGDFFRFIREGHMNFNNYTELLPDDYLDKFINIKNNSRNKWFSNKFFRITAAKLAKFLNIVRYIDVVDITKLCQRFCKEMNLPGEIFLAVQNLISKTNPKVIFTKKHTIIPNYEGRAMSIIIVTLKLLFGMDGVTEIELSRYAQLVNSLGIDIPKMFDIVKWMEYVGYRNLIISEYHFPTAYSQNLNINSNLFVQYVKSRNITYDKSIKLSKEKNDYKELLTNLQQFEYNSDTIITFPSSLTPFLEYSKILSNNRRYDQENILSKDFQEHSLDFLIRPKRYLQLVGSNVKIKHGGANDTWIIENIKNYGTEKLASYQDRKLCPVEIVQRDLTMDEHKITEKPKILNIKLDPTYVQTRYEECRRHKFRENEIYIRRISKRVKFNSNINNVRRLLLYNNHFNPYERYWLFLQMNSDCLDRKICDDFFNKHSNTFKLVFKECARIIEQTVQELLYDFQYCELFLIFAASYKDKTDTPKAKELLDVRLKYYVSQAEAFW